MSIGALLASTYPPGTVQMKLTDPVLNRSLVKMVTLKVGFLLG